MYRVKFKLQNVIDLQEQIILPPTLSFWGNIGIVVLKEYLNY